MKKLIKKSLDELAKTMDVISDEEQNDYWGMGYDNDCFWQCVAYLSSGGAPVSEATVAGLAEEYFASVGHYAYYNLSVTNDAQMTNIAMTAYINEKNIKKNMIYGFSSTILNQYPEFSGMSKLQHLVVFKGPKNGGVEMHCPQTGQTFIMSLSHFGQASFPY